MAPPRCPLLRCCCGGVVHDSDAVDAVQAAKAAKAAKKAGRGCTPSCGQALGQAADALPSYFSEPPPSCKKLLRRRAGPSKVVLFPDEAWARNATSSYWTLAPVWWSPNRCVVVEVSGTRRIRTRARMEESSNGNLHIIGSFKTDVDPNFKLCLTSRVSAADFNMGYSMTGTLERGCKRTNSFQVTHFAVIRRHEVATPTT